MNGETDLTRNSTQPAKTSVFISCGCAKCNPAAMEKRDKEAFFSRLGIREQDCILYTIEDGGINDLATNGVARRVRKMLAADPNLRALTVYVSTDCERDQQRFKPDEIRRKQETDMWMGFSNLREEMNILGRQVGISLFHHDRSLGPYPRQLRV